MRFICPGCVTSFEIPDEAIGALVTCTKCGASFPPASAQTYLRPPTPVALSSMRRTPGVAWEGPPEGTKLGGYTLETPLGSGGMGVVYRALQTSLSRPVALKVLPPELSSDPEFVERFHREALTLGALSHPRIVSVIDRGVENGMAFLAMELVEGESLRQRMARSSIPQKELVRLAIQVCEGLSYAHAKGVVHRDIKPENLLLDRDGSVKIADFGLARIVRGDSRESLRLTMSNVALGTPFYMAPEQMEGAAAVDARADLYSLGVVLYEALTGGLPIGRFETPREKFKDIDPRLDRLVLRLLEKSPDRRPSSADEVASALREVLETPVPSAPPPDEPTRLRPAVPAIPVPPFRPQKTGAMSAVLVAGVAAAVAVLGFVLLSVRQQPARPEPVAIPSPTDLGGIDPVQVPNGVPLLVPDQSALIRQVDDMVATYRKLHGGYPASGDELFGSMKMGRPTGLEGYEVRVDPKTGKVTFEQVPPTPPQKGYR